MRSEAGGFKILVSTNIMLSTLHSHNVLNIYKNQLHPLRLHQHISEGHNLQPESSWRNLFYFGKRCILSCLCWDFYSCITPHDEPGADTDKLELILTQETWCGHPAPDEPGYMMQIWTCWTQLSENMNKAIRESGPVCWCHQSYMISSVSKMCPALCSCSTVRFWSSEIINMFWRGFFLKKTTVAKLCDQIDMFKWGYLD